jgi:nucleotide-binding universal stress UspA family protein
MPVEVAPMRILLATDASRSADRARDLVASLPWPAGSIIRVVAAMQRSAPILKPPLAAAFAIQRDPADARLAHTLDTALDAATRLIGRPDLRVERYLLVGRPGSAIIDEARQFAPDLIVVGSRGHGRFESMLLGSVSAEVVDHAPCPVLVVRDSTIDGILLADDGSKSASTARQLLLAWPIFHDVPVTVLSVAETELPTGSGFAPGITEPVIEAWTESAEEARRRSAELARQGAEAITRAGGTAWPLVGEGDPAHAIVEEARRREVGLIIAGTRGHTGIRRLLLGSVARNVLLHAPCSVLIVREKTVVHHEQPAEAVASRT